MFFLILGAGAFFLLQWSRRQPLFNSLKTEPFYNCNRSRSRFIIVTGAGAVANLAGSETLIAEEGKGEEMRAGWR